MTTTDSRRHVLIVDDEEPIRRILERLLTRAGHDCSTAADVNEARALLQREEFSLVLSDVNMPGESGLALLELVRLGYPETAVVMVTGVDDPTAAQPALDLGAHGYVVKPFEANEILINIANALRRIDLEKESRAHRIELEERVAERTALLQRAVHRLGQTEQALRRSHVDAIRRLAYAAEFRDPCTGEHLNRMSRYSRLLAEKAGFAPERCDVVHIASTLHDIGKIAIPDDVLLKPGLFTPAEREVMQQHPRLGADMLTGADSALLRLGAVIARTHHERWDGAGYPAGLAGEAIPIEGRIVAVADVFDALTSERPYKPAYSTDRSAQIIAEGRGTQFDPALVDLFLADVDAFVAAGAEPLDAPPNTSAEAFG